MAALTGPRKISKLDGPNSSPVGYLVKAGVKIFHGQMIGPDTNGYWAPASTTIPAQGVAKLDDYDDQDVTGQASTFGMSTGNMVDNTTGADGDRKVHVEFGTFLFDNKAGDLVTASAPGKRPAYVEDDHTVRATAAGSVLAGGVVGIHADGQVYVSIQLANVGYARF